MAFDITGLLLKRGMDALTPEQLVSLQENPEEYAAIAERLQALADTTNEARRKLSEERELRERDLTDKIRAEIVAELAAEREALARERAILMEMRVPALEFVDKVRPIIEAADYA
jgi:hypothetical protein